jgi:hypothetical protein
MNFEKFDTKTLARWYDIFNGWKWPEDFIIQKPEDWDNLPNWKEKERSKFSVSRPYTSKILCAIGMKETLRYHHINNLNMSNFQFEIWWIVFNFNGFMQKYFENFYFNVYDFFEWR